MPGEIASAKFIGEGGKGNAHIQLATGADPRLLVLLAHGLLQAAEERGVLTTAVAQARSLLEEQMKDWGLSKGPAIPRMTVRTDGH